MGWFCRDRWPVPNHPFYLQAVRLSQPGRGSQPGPGA
jgi:hypothetical protein